MIDAEVYTDGMTYNIIKEIVQDAVDFEDYTMVMVCF